MTMGDGSWMRVRAYPCGFNATVWMLLCTSCAELAVGSHAPMVHQTTRRECTEHRDASAQSGSSDTVLGQGYQCHINSQGWVMCRGRDQAGNLGGVSPWNLFRRQFEPVLGVSDAVEIVGNDSWTNCARTTRGEVWCWGSNEFGLIGSGHDEDESCGPIRCRRHATRVLGIPPAERLLADRSSVCILGDDKSVWCWGRIHSSRSGGFEEHSVPTQIRGRRQTSGVSIVLDTIVLEYLDGTAEALSTTLSRFVQSGTRFHWSSPGMICHSDPNSTLSCHSMTDDRSLSMPCIRDAAFGMWHSCVVDGDGMVACWGGNSNGECGVNPNEADRCPGGFSGQPCIQSPHVVRGIDHVVRVFVGVYQTCATREDRSVWCWGVVGDHTTAAPERVDW